MVRFDVFENCGQEQIGSRWVITQKEKSDGQKSKINGCFIAIRFQEKEKPQSHSPTLLRESLKIYILLWQLLKNSNLGIYILEQLSCKQIVWIE